MNRCAPSNLNFYLFSSSLGVYPVAEMMTLYGFPTTAMREGNLIVVRCPALGVEGRAENAADAYRAAFDAAHLLLEEDIPAVIH